MTENPYCLARDIRSIGLRTADAIAMKLGIEKTVMVRVRAGIGCALTEAMDEGHCGLPEEEGWPLAPRLQEIPDDRCRNPRTEDVAGETSCRFTARSWDPVPPTVEGLSGQGRLSGILRALHELDPGDKFLALVIRRCDPEGLDAFEDCLLERELGSGVAGRGGSLFGRIFLPLAGVYVGKPANFVFG